MDESTFRNKIGSLSAKEQAVIQREAGASLRRIRDREWKNNTLAMAYKLIESGYQTRSTAENLETQIRRWIREGIPLRNVHKIASALDKPIDDFLPGLHSLDIAVNRPHPGRFHGQTVISILISCSIIIGAVTAYRNLTGIHGPRGEIFFPTEQAKTPRLIVVTGQTENIADNWHAWLVVEIGDLWWAKKEIPTLLSR